MSTGMNLDEAITYLRPIAESATVGRYAEALGLVLAAAGVTQPEPEYEYRCKLDSIRPDDFHEWVEVDEAHQCPGTKERRVIKAGDWEPVPNQTGETDGRS